MPQTQYQAVTGHVLPTRYPSVAPAGYLAARTALQRTEAYNQAIMEAEARRMALEERTAAENARLASQGQKLQEEQANTANLIGLGSLAGNVYLASQMGGGGAGGKAAKEGIPFLSKAASYAMKPVEALKTVGTKMLEPSAWKGNLTSPAWLAGTAVGAVAAPYLADQGVIPFGGRAEKEIAAAGLTSGLATGLMMGDPFAALASSLVSGGLTALRKWL